MKNTFSFSLKQFGIKLDMVDSVEHRLLLMLSILLGFALRLYSAYAGHGYHYFAINDEVSAYEYALRFLAGDEKAHYLGQPAFAGGQVPGPMWTLFWVMLLKLGNTVDGAVYWMAALNSIAIYLVYRLALNFLTPGHALLSTVLFATAAWPIYYSAGLWNPLPLALLGVLLFLSLWRITQHENSRTVFWACLVAAIIPQFHMIGLFYLPAILLILILTPVRLNKFWFVAGIIAGILIYTPYIIGEMNASWDNTRKILEQEREFSFGVAKIITAPATVLSLAPGEWPGKSVEEFKAFGNAIFGSYFILVAVSLASLVNAFIFIASFSRKYFAAIKMEWTSPKNAFSISPEIQFIGILLFFPLLLFVGTGHDYATRYTTLILPLLFILPAYFFQNLTSGRFKSIWLGNLVVMVVLNTYLATAFYSYQKDKANGYDTFYASFRNLESLRKILRDDAGRDTYIEVELGNGINQLPEHRQKTYRTVGHYLQIYQKYVSHIALSKSKSTYLLNTAEVDDKSDKTYLLHKNGIKLLPMPH